MGNTTALLVDFENLVIGFDNQFDENDDIHLDPGLFFRLAEEEGGHVAVALAFADWRSLNFNRHQASLYRNGFELVHVLGRKNKNAVDVRLAIDAVELIYRHPHIETFVIVSGDRDFIHLLKVLRQHNKRVIGVAPQKSASDDLAFLCDRFVTYYALWSSYNQRDEDDTQSSADIESLNVFKVQLAELFTNHVGEEGIMGARLKPLIRRHISATFDETSYGYPKFITMMRDLTDVVRVEKPPKGGGDVRLYLADSQGLARSSASTSQTRPIDTIVAQLRAKLSSFSIDWDRVVRDAILTKIFEVFLEHAPLTPIRAVEILEDMPLSNGEELGTKRVQDYVTVCWQSHMFNVVQSQAGSDWQERGLEFRAEYKELGSFTERFEVSLVYKVLHLLPSNATTRYACVQQLLEIEPADAGEEEYIRGLVLDAEELKRRR